METIDLSKQKRTDTPLRAIIYGEAGSGKTHLLRSFPKPLLLMDWDGKYEPLIGIEGVEVVSYYSSEAKDAEKLIPKFWRDWQEVKKDPKWNTVVLDSLTSLDRTLERYMVMTSGKSKSPDAIATIQEYGAMKLWYKTYLSSLCSVPTKNIVVLAHEDFNKDAESEIVSIRPKVTGKIGEDLSSIFKDTWYLEVKQSAAGIQRVLHYQKYKKYICASVSLEGNGVVEEPTYEKIMKARAK